MLEMGGTKQGANGDVSFEGAAERDASGAPGKTLINHGLRKLIRIVIEDHVCFASDTHSHEYNGGFLISQF